MGIALFIALLVLGIIASTHGVTEAGLHADIDISHLRSAAWTPVEQGLSTAASPAVGIIVLVLAALALISMRRRFDALRAIAAAGTGWVGALVVKEIISRPRPPASVWLVRPDHSGSFPSGTTTTATVLFLIILILAWRSQILRTLVMILGVLFTLAVGFSRLYLGDHYPLDVVGAYLTVTATTIFVLAVLDTTWARRFAARWLHASGAPVSARAEQIPGARRDGLSARRPGSGTQSIRDDRPPW